MRMPLRYITPALFSFAVLFPHADEVRITTSPLSVGAFHELGAVYNGLYTQGDASGGTFGMEWLDRFGAFMATEAVVNERLHLRAGLGGVFQFRKPETVGSGFAFHQRKAFFIAPARTEAVYHFGEDPAEPWLRVGAGMFPYKYNPDAWNLGEYLFRARAYPTFNTTGGYVNIHSAGATLQGFKAELERGNLKFDALLTTQTELAPFYDWSLAFVGSYSLAGGLLDLGAGVNFHHLIPVRPSRTANPERENAYLRDPATGEAYVGNTEYYWNAADYHYTNGDNVRGDRYAAMGSTADSLFGLPDGQRPRMHYYTASATLLMARASLDPKALFEMPVLGNEDLKMYAELNVLGVKNYPVFYENVTDRMPVMFGFNVPTFRVLDILAVQFEYFNSPWLNNTYSIASGSNDRVNNTPFLPSSSDAVLADRVYGQSGKDNWKWSVLASRQFQGRITVSAQVARDHMRLPSSEFYYGPQFDPNEITAFPDSWYWMTQVSWGL